MKGRASWAIVALALVGGACTRPAADASGPVPAAGAPAPPIASAPPAPPVGSVTPAPPTTTVPPATTLAPTTTQAPTTTTTTTTSTTTTTTTLPLDVYDPACVVQVQPGDSILAIAERLDDETVLGPAIQAENGLPDEVIQPGQLLDVCVDNALNDITGESIGRNSVFLAADVIEQQEKLNELFAGLGIRELLVDGVSGPVTRQRLCAARLALGLPVSTQDMAPGSDEESVLMAATTLPLPFTTALASERWILIDRTCQIMFVGEGVDRLVFVFPTSTGQPGYETRDQDRSRVFKFNPALDNGGWHNSLTYPAAEDNPLNGNMYKPLYFDRGQAIHGANNVPRSPASKGCARLRVEDQDALIAWLGLADSGPTSDRGRINVTVNVQGTWVD